MPTINNPFASTVKTIAPPTPPAVATDPLFPFDHLFNGKSELWADEYPERAEIIRDALLELRPRRTHEIHFRELAKLLGCSATTVRKTIAPHVLRNTENTTRYSVASVCAYLEKLATEKAEK